MRELHFRRGSPLECGVMGIACSSFYLVWWSRLQTNKKAYSLFTEFFYWGGGGGGGVMPTIENGRVYVHFH